MPTNWPIKKRPPGDQVISNDRTGTGACVEFQQGSGTVLSFKSSEDCRCSVGRLQEPSQTATFQYIPSKKRPNMTEELWPFASNRICPGNCTSGYRATKQAVRAWRRDKNPPKSAASLLHDEVFFLSNSRNIVTRIGTQSHSYLYCIVLPYCIVLHHIAIHASTSEITTDLPSLGLTCTQKIKLSVQTRHEIRNHYKVWLCRPYNLQTVTYPYTSYTKFPCLLWFLAFLFVKWQYARTTWRRTVMQTHRHLWTTTLW